MNRRGFTIVELVIVIVIMGVLLVLGMLSLRSGQQASRDNERTTDVANIARFFEDSYTNGTNQGSYPPTTALSQASTFEGLDEASLYAPDTPTNGAKSLKAATSTATPTFSSNDYSSYIYQPLTDSGGLCTSTSTSCRQFTIYYNLEKSGITKLESKHQ